MSDVSNERFRNDGDGDTDIEDAQRTSHSDDGSVDGTVESCSREDAERSIADDKDTATDDVLSDFASLMDSSQRDSTGRAASLQNNSVPRHQRSEQTAATEPRSNVRRTIEEKAAKHKVGSAKVRRSLPPLKRIERAKKPPG